MILKEWDDISKIRKFLIDRNFIEIPYNSNNSQLNNLQSIYFRTGLSKYAQILGIIQLNPDDPNPSKVIELYKEVQSEYYSYKFQVDLLTYLILITPDKRKIIFAYWWAGRSKTLTKVLPLEDLIFERKLAKLTISRTIWRGTFPISNHSFKSLFEKKKDHMIREELIEDLVVEGQKIPIDALQKNLNFHDTKEFHIQVLEWAKKFHLIVDGDFLIVNKDNLSIFMDELDRKYKEWEKMEIKKEDKS